MIDYIFVTLDQQAIGVRFDQNVKVDSLSADKFRLYLDTATPTEIPNAFAEIETCDDFDSIRRILKLRPVNGLTANTAYTLTSSGVEYAGLGTGDDDSFDFTTTAAVAASHEPTPEAVFIEDHSIKSNSAISYSESVVVTPVSEFYVVEADPLDGDYYVEPDYENGRLKIVFSSNPDTDYLTSEYIKVQRKLNQLAPTRWETVTVQYSISSNKPWVYLSFPAIEDSSIYREDGYTYFQENYTYRVKLSRYIKAA